MKLNYLVFADKATIGNANKLTLDGVFSKIFAPGVPTLHAEMAAAFEIAEIPSGAENVEVHLQIRPKGTDLVIMDQPLALRVVADDGGRATGLINIKNLVFPNFGEYDVVVVSGGETLGSSSLNVILVS